MIDISEAVEISAENFDNYIKSVVREHHWTPEKIGSLYCDDADFFGLEYWYKDVKEVSEELKKPKTGK